ncbi:MAG TPA: enoyl-CoA hydratase-related protein [Acidimicrobiales bacterium]|nr:enoyl-CoA hydratase-related protein [Acidimicrobiales bacterium]
MTDEHGEPVLLVDRPGERIVRLTLNRPEKRNALSNELRSALFDALRDADADPEVSVVIIRGAGPCFSAGYDLSGPNRPVERATAPRDGWWSRHVVTGWFEMWDMSTPIVAQVHGWCLAGGSELAAACDLVYVADDARIGYPPVRLMSPPDLAWQPWLLGMRRAMEALLTGDSMSGTEAVEAGYANRAFPAGQLDEAVLERAERVAKVPGDLLALNKRVVHRAMEAAGMRTGLRATAEIQALGFHQQSSRQYMASLRERPLRDALSERDAPFSDYRTAGAEGPAR